MMQYEPQPGEVAHVMRNGRCHRRAYALGAGVMVTLMALVAGNAAWADPAPSVEITPNAILKPDETMTVEIHGSPGEAWMSILKNCDNDRNTPETKRSRGCDPVIWRRKITLEGPNRWKGSLSMAVVPEAGGEQTLWLRVSQPIKNGRWHYGDAVFTIASNPCSVWDTFIDLFSGNECKIEIRSLLQPMNRWELIDAMRLMPSMESEPEALGGIPRFASMLQVLDSMLQMRGSDQRPAAPLEVRLLARDPLTGTWAEPRSVRGTHGATGTAWASERSLFVTVDRAGEDVETPPRLTRPGLYRLDIASGERTLLRRARAGEILTAPFAVRPDSVVFVRERVTASADGTVATLAVWRSGRIIRQIPLRRTIHQILAAEPGQRSVLAYSRWQGVPALLRIDLRTGLVTHLGFPLELFHAVMRAPGDGPIAVAVEDRFDYNAWDLVLIEKDRLIRHVGGADEALMPAWRPDSLALAYLASPR